jgi:hypothetical protein
MVSNAVMKRHFFDSAIDVIASFTSNVALVSPICLASRLVASTPSLEDIKSWELAFWNGLGQKVVDSMTLTTPNVKHACAFLWLADQPFDKLDYLVDKPCIKNSRCFFCLQLLELRVFRIRDASAFAGAFHHLALPSTFPIYTGST